jgi:hypothetical protein
MGPASRQTALCVVAYLVAVFTLASCGGGARTPTQPSAPPPAPPAPPSTAGTLRGVVTDILTGGPVEGATLAFTLAGSTPTTTTTAGGAWEFTQPSSNLTAIPVEVSAPGYVTRKAFLRWATGTRSDIAIDIIKDSQPFSLTYYRALVRNLFSAPDAPAEPLRRWTKAPNFYIYTHNPRTGRDILPSEVDLLIATIRSAVPQLTGGQFGAGEIEVGAVDRAQRSGFINLKFVYDEEGNYCGRAFVGSDPGEITINYGADGCRTTCGGFAPRTVAHEVGHAMGFFHVADGRVLNTVWSNRDCGVTTFSAAEQHHARVAYARPVGSRDPDIDPASSSFLQAPGAPPVRLSCR